MRTVVSTSELTRVAQGREAEIFAWEDGSVVRLFRDTDAGTRLRRESVAMRAARKVLPLVPEVLGETIIEGRPGLIMERIEGDALMTLIGRRPWTIWSASRVTGRVHAEINNIAAPAEIETLHERIDRLVRRSDHVPHQLRDFALTELASLPEGNALCHGDFHPGNILQSRRGAVVIDWANTARGDATADFARSRMMGRLGSFPPGTPALIRIGRAPGLKLYDAGYVGAYRDGREVDMALAERWEAVRCADRLTEGIPEERDRLLRVLARARMRRA